MMIFYLVCRYLINEIAMGDMTNGLEGSKPFVIVSLIVPNTDQVISGHQLPPWPGNRGCHERTGVCLKIAL